MTFPALAVAIIQLYKRPDKGFLTGWLFGLGWFGAGISWVHVSIADFGGMPLFASVGIMVLLCAYLALYPALAFWVTKRVFTPALWPLSLPAAWFVTEWLRSWMLSGFPWLSLGYSQIDSPLAGWMPVIGETGVSALIIVLCSAGAIWLLRRQYLPLALLFAVTFVSGYLLRQHNWVTLHEQKSVAMVQGNIKQSLRWVPEQDGPTMEKYRKLTQPLLDNDLIIWPEAAVPKLEYLANSYLSNMDDAAARHGTAIVTGIVNYNFETEEAWNNLIVLGEKTDGSGPHYRYFSSNRYAKHHLLPVGEFVPFEDFLRPLAPLFDLPMSSFARGDFVQPNLVANGIHLAPAICFEIAFPHQVAANIQRDTDMIVTVSNDAWFGDSHGPAQHLEIARVRALEFGRPVIRATNNGITAFINERGSVTGILPQFEEGSISATVTTTRGITPYRYLGEIPVALLLAISIGTAWVMQRKHRHR